MGMRKKGWIIILSLITLVGFLVFVFAEGIVGTAVISTDKSDYAPEETVLISGEGFTPSTPITLISILRPDSTTDTCPSDNCTAPLPTTDLSGSFSDYAYKLDGISGTYTINALDALGVSGQGSFEDHICSSITCTEDCQCIDRCGDGKYWYYEDGDCTSDCSGGSKHCKYDHRQCSQSCGASCDEDSDCKCVGNKYASSATCSGSCSCSGQGGAVCSVGHCGATCDATHPCTATECDNLDGCVGSDYYNYNDVSNACLAGCTCENNACGNPTIIPNDPRCITPPSCGNQIVEPPEICDGNSQSCTTTQGYSGTQSCNVLCSGWNDCISTQYCGDGQTNGNEQCDTTQNCPIGQTCNSGCQCVPIIAQPVCNPPDCNDQNPCTTDTCNTQGICEHTLNDNQGPVTSDVLVSPNYNNGIFNATATATDQCSNIATSEYFLRKSSVSINCGTNGTGTPMNASDGSFNALVENVTKNNIEFFQDGSNRICVQSKDIIGNWGNCQCYYYESDTIPPEIVGNVTLNNVTNPYELPVCGNNPKLKVVVCDSQSDIQGGEFFLDMLVPPLDVPEPRTGNWLSIDSEYMNGGLHCSGLNATINLTNLNEGTHYINQIRGKDIVENWGKVYGQNFNFSFIKDTKSPNTTKTVDSLKVQCQITNDDTNPVEECWYIQQGTHIHLSAIDPDTPDHEIAGLDKIMCQFRWKNNTGDQWGAWSVPAECTNPIVFNEDSFHEIKYWAVDKCGNAEQPHYEIDIVDTLAPVTTKTVGTPNVTATGGYDYYVNQSTQICLSATDAQPHPVGRVSISCDYDWWATDPNEKPDGHVDVILDGQGCFTYGEDSYHKLTCTATDALGNNATLSEKDIVDTQAPTITKTIIGPSSGNCPPISTGDTCFIDGVTNISVTATDDQQPHPVEGVTCDWSYTVNNDEPIIGQTGVSSPFIVHFLEESSHLLTITCRDALGNSVTDTETFLVDKTPPITTKTYTGLQYPNPITELTLYPHWITNKTLITLTVNDAGPHKSGIKETYYKVSLVDDSYCASQSACQQATGLAKAYDAASPKLMDGSSFPFTIPEDSCHLIEYYSVDNVDKTEQPANKQCVFVDNKAPNSSKVVGDPKYPCLDGEEKCGPQGTWPAKYVTTQTPINITCVDQLPHPVDNSKFCFKVTLGNEGLTGKYCNTYQGQIDQDSSCCINQFTFNFLEESLHKIEWTCADALGNKGTTQIEWDNVDDTPPNITIDDPNFIDSIVRGCSLDVVTEIKDFKVGTNESTVYATIASADNPNNEVMLGKLIKNPSYNGHGFFFNGDGYEQVFDISSYAAGKYILRVYASDLLGNPRVVNTTITLESGIFVDRYDLPSCSIPLNGGLCSLTFKACVRNSSAMDFYMGKIKNNTVSPVALNGTLIIGDNSGVVGSINTDGSISFNGDIVSFSSDGCTIINGKRDFTLQLNFTSEIVSLIGSGDYSFDWNIHSFLDESCIDID